MTNDNIKALLDQLYNDMEAGNTYGIGTESAEDKLVKFLRANFTKAQIQALEVAAEVAGE